MTDRELMQQALRYMESIGEMDTYPEDWAIAIALRERLAQPEQEPVAWMYVNTDGECEQIEYETPPDDPSITPLYTAPPRREWQGLTDEELTQFKRLSLVGVEIIEARLKEKNT